MIKLTIHPKTYSFDQPQVIIGAGSVDLSLEGLKHEHLKIQEQNGRFIVTNLANDPFAYAEWVSLCQKGP